MRPDRFAKFQQVLTRRQPDLTLIADQVNKPQNLSALIRTADAVGIPQIHAVVPREGYRDFSGTARGSGQWVEVIPHEDEDAALAAVREQGMQVVVAHLCERAVNYRAVDYTRPTALLMGAEMQGVSASAIAAADHQVIVPMMGMVGALNVSVAAGIILAEAQRQRAEAGLYERCRLDADTYRNTLFRWLYPEIASYCRRHGVAYPALDEQGYLVDPAGWRQRLAEPGVARRG